MAHRGIKMAVVYCCPVEACGEEHIRYARRFVDTWLANPPGASHQLIVVSNGGPPSAATIDVFKKLPRPDFIEHDDSGWDIGAFQYVSRLLVKCDLGLFFGGNVYFNRSGWLSSIARKFDGESLYGTFTSLIARPHIRTSAFWLPPELLNRYPKTVKTIQERYDFEHREGCLTDWVETVGRQAVMQTWDGCVSKPDWGKVLAYYSERRSNFLFADKLSDDAYRK